MKPVKSSDLAQVGYSISTKLLQVQFQKGGQIYQYPGVPVALYQNLISSKSLGSFFNSEIKPRFKGTNVTPPKPKS
jgi:hypothetical protein